MYQLAMHESTKGRTVPNNRLVYRLSSVHMPSSCNSGLVYNPFAMLDRLTELEEQPYTEEDAEWDHFVTTHPHGSLLQTTAWARLKNRFGWRSHRVWLKLDGQLAAGAQILVRSAAFGLIRETGARGPGVSR